MNTNPPTNTQTFRLPQNADPTNPQHRARIEQIAKTNFGNDTQIQSINTTTRIVTVTQPTKENENWRPTKWVQLTRGHKPSDGDKIAAEQERKNPGYTLTKYEPYLNRAGIAQLTDAEIKARAAMAEVLNTKPWEIQVFTRPQGGFTFQLPTYIKSRHETKIIELAEVTLGKPGWYHQIDEKSRTCHIIPGELPTFQPAYPYPKTRPNKTMFELPVGITLPAPGQTNKPLTVDLDGNSGMLIQGLAGAGKSVQLNALVYAALEAGHQIAILNVPHKAVDFEWVKPYVQTYGWGCDSTAAGYTALKHVYDTGVERGKLLKQHGAQKWQELPPNIRQQHPIITIFIDEVAGLFTADPIPKLDSEHPLRIQAEQQRTEKELIRALATKIPAELRFVGIRLIMATQQAQSNMGIPPSVKINLPNRILLGAKATKQARGHAFASPDSAPEIPDYIKDDPTQARGAGIAEFEGRPTVVYKSYFETVDTYLEWIKQSGRTPTAQPEPTEEMINEAVPHLSEDAEEEKEYAEYQRRTKSSGYGFGAPDGRDAPEQRLKGAALAAHQLKQQNG